MLESSIGRVGGARLRAARISLVPLPVIPFLVASGTTGGRIMPARAPGELRPIHRRQPEHCQDHPPVRRVARRRRNGGRMKAAKIRELADVYRRGLLEDILPFWTTHAVDRECGGFTTCLDRDGSLLDTDKGVWQQCRFAWMMGELYNTVERRPEWLNLARHGIDFITRFCFDPADGRMWFHLTREGRPIRKRRYAFSESFACIAYGEYAKATGSGEFADRARQVFLDFVGHNTIPGRMAPKFTDTRPTKGLGFPMITIVSAQELRDSIGLPEAGAWIDRCIDEIRRDFVKDDIECVMEVVGPKGETYDHFDGRTLLPGHSIEAAWFIMREGQHRGDNSLVELGCRMLGYMWQRGWDKKHGGMLYFTDVDGKPVQEYWHDMKFWWTHNETIIATLMAHALTGEAIWEKRHAMVHKWAYSHFPDRKYGEWYGYLHRDGSVSVPLKGNLWKGCFHLPRMQLVCWKLLEQMQAQAPKEDTANGAPRKRSCK